MDGYGPPKVILTYFSPLTPSGVSVCLFSLFSHVIKDRLFLSEALIATVLGVIFGPLCLDIFNPYYAFVGGEQALYKVMLEISRVGLCIQCLAAGVSLPGSYVKREWKSLFMLLGPVMTGKWIVSSLILKFVLGLGYVSFFCVYCDHPCRMRD